MLYFRILKKIKNKMFLFKTLPKVLAKIKISTEKSGFMENKLPLTVYNTFK